MKPTTRRKVFAVLMIGLVAVTSWFIYSAFRQQRLDSALLYYTSAGKVAQVKTLLDSGANPNAQIVVPVIGQEPSIVRRFLESLGVSGSDSLTITPLVAAVLGSIADDEADRLAVVQLLLERGAEVNQSSASGVTALTVAAIHGHVEIARLLLEQGTNVYHADDGGNTALKYAQMNHHPDLVSLLKKADAKN